MATKSPAQLQREIDQVLAKKKKPHASAKRKLDDFTRAYLNAALWASTDEQGVPLDKNYDISDFAPEALDAAIKDATTFQSRNTIDLVKASKLAKPSEYSSAAQHGHDFWLTRNGLGVGFWDRGYGAVGDRLSKAAKAYGSKDIYVGDDGLLYFS